MALAEDAAAAASLPTWLRFAGKTPPAGMPALRNR